MKRIWAVFLIVLLSGLTIGQTLPDYTTLVYGAHEIDVTIAPNENAIFMTHMKFGDSLKVELEVVDGGVVDFFLMDNYTAYQTYISNKTELSYLGAPYSQSWTPTIAYQYTSKLDDTLFVVIDNTALTENGASPTGDVTVQGQITVKKNVWTLQNIILTIIIITAIIVVFAKFTYKPKKRKPPQ